jgi:hypothetical protein
MFQLSRLRAADPHETNLSTEERTHGRPSRHPWPTATPYGGNNIVRLADAKIVAWSMYPTNLLPTGGLLIREKRSDCASGEPHLWSNLSVFTAIE